MSTDIYLLVDRSGSMGVIWGEAVASINACVEELIKQDQDCRLTLAAFDGFEGFRFDLLRDAVPVRRWKPLEETEVTPRGCTPLFDAVGRIVSLAESRDEDKAVIVVMTDGYENASIEVTLADVKAALDRVDKRGWQAVFLGASFDNRAQAASMGAGCSRTMNMAIGHFDCAMRACADLVSEYADRDAPIAFSLQNREDAGENKVAESE